LTDADKKITQLISTALSAHDLSVAVKFYSGPVGRSIHAKQRAFVKSAAFGVRPYAFLTAEERKALIEYQESPEGKDVIARLNGLKDQELEIIGPVRAKIRADYCSTIKDCPPG